MAIESKQLCNIRDRYGNLRDSLINDPATLELWADRRTSDLDRLERAYAPHKAEYKNLARKGGDSDG